MIEIHDQKATILIRRLVIVWVVQAISLLIVVVLPNTSITATSFGSLLLFIAILGFLNALIWPTITRLTLPLTVYTLGLASFVFNGIMLMFVAGLVAGVEIGSVGDAVWVSILLTITNTALSSLLSVDDDESFFRNSLKRAMQKQYTPNTTKDGVLFLEIDGLAEPILKKAMAGGHMPNLASWVQNGTHKVIEWETDWSSQTGASQAGILLGDNSNIPAFRWVDKANGNKIVESNGPKDAPIIEKSHTTGNGLLANNGASRTNLFSGNAPDVMFTFSTLTGITKLYNKSYYSFFSKPYNFVRTIMFTIWDAIKEIQNRRFQTKHNVVPRLEAKRKGMFPILRAFTTVFLRDLTIYTLIGDIYAGQADSIYATFVGYDEVAHHSGIDDPDALYTLKMLDKQFGKLMLATKDAQRTYHIVILSDHGQTKGSTFKQRYDMTLEDLVKSAMPKDIQSKAYLNTNEDWGQLNAVLTEYAGDEEKISGKVLNSTLKNNMDNGIVQVGPQTEEKVPNADVIVLASGNLGLIYFTQVSHRLTMEELNEKYPNLLATLSEHEGIGFIVVNSSEYGAVAIGKSGKNYLSQDRVDRQDPLTVFGPNAKRHILRTNSYTNAPDILVNSFYKPETNEGAAFEELIGFHGGLGGTQSQPFIMPPASWYVPEDKIIGAENVHKVLHSWIDTATKAKSPKN